MHEAKTESTLVPADKENNTEPEKEDREQENEAKKDKDPNSDKGGHVNTEALTKATCALDFEGVKPKAIISHTTTRDEAEEEQETACDWTPDTEFSVVQLQSSATDQRNPQSRARRRSRRRPRFMSTPVWPICVASTIPAAIWLEPRLPALTAQDLIAVFLYHWGICFFSLLLRDLTEEQQQVEQLKESLVKEKERRKGRKEHRSSR